MRCRAWIVAVTVLFMSSWAEGTARASLVDDWLSVGQLVARSDGIFIGRVIDARSAWDGERGEICTFATVEVQSELKGAADADGTIRIRIPGGRVGSVIERVGGAPQFMLDETVLVFVTSGGDGCFRLVGMAQGKYAIRQDPYSGIPFAISNASGLQRLVPASAGGYVAEPAAQREVLLRDLIDAIEQHTYPRLVMR